MRDRATPAARALASELLGLGAGCRDGGCVLGGPGAQPGAQHTNGGCKCLTYRPDGSLRPPLERIALREAINAAGLVLDGGL